MMLQRQHCPPSHVTVFNYQLLASVIGRRSTLIIRSLSITVRGGLAEAHVPLHAAAVEISLQGGPGTEIALSAWM